ncbi:MAG: fluoride efflux transporter CrcB [Bacteroidales bacterium]|nr:fluoride efflux transporter CrcB [Bacteroidales bacterium]
MLKNILFVILGSSVGATCRYLVGEACSHFRFASFPLGTFVVNVLGCFFMGMLMGYAQKSSSNLPETAYLMLTVGFCGTFTTFSTFTADTFSLMNSGRYLITVAYLVSSLLLGLLTFYLGRKLMM